MVRRLFLWLVVGGCLTGCGCLQPYHRLYILAEKISAEEEGKMAAKTLSDKPIKPLKERIEVD